MHVFGPTNTVNVAVCYPVGAPSQWSNDAVETNVFLGSRRNQKAQC